MTELADVTVVIPAWRASGTIARALTGVAAQTLRPREVVVVDDGSDDGTADVARAMAPALDGIALEVVRQENQGAGAARNRALALATSTWIAFLDADDEWLPEKLEHCMARLERGDLVLVGHNGWIVDGREQRLIDGAARFRLRDDPWVGLFERGYLDTCTVVARRDALLAVGGFDRTLANAQDFDLWLALLEGSGARFEVLERPLSRYYVVSGSIMSHTRRRLICCLTIARRFAPRLRQRAGSLGALASVAFRVLAVHKEALDVFRSRNDWDGIARTLAEFPVHLLLAVLALLRPSTEARPDFIYGGTWLSRSRAGPGVIATLWLWVVGVMGLYLWQFRDLTRPVLDLVLPS